MSRVFLATDCVLNRPVVIKVLSPQLAAGISTERFAREVRVASNLQQANIVPVFASGIAAGLPFYTMPYVDGLSLRSRLHSRPDVPAQEATAILNDVARALAFAHERGVVHRDIKPENILLSGGAAVVTDFGIAKALSESTASASTSGTLTEVGTAIGTPAYMSPEQASGDEVDARSDVYAWGVIAYELLTGRHPFADRSTSAALIRAHIAETPPAMDLQNRGISPALAALVMGALQKDPVARPASGRELCSALARLSTSETATQSRSRSILIVALTATALLAAFFWVLLRANSSRIPVTARADADPAKSVAVLPFVNVGNNPEQEYFSDGVSDEIADALARIPKLRLASRTSSFAFKGQTTLDARQIAQKLNVASLLEGQVLRSGSRIRVSAQLTDAGTGHVIWHDRYERDVRDVFAVQEEIARSIASALQISLSSADNLRAGTTNLEAHDLYLRGRFEHDKFTERGLRRAITLYDSAIRLDPNYVAAHTWLAFGWFNLADDFVAPVEALPKAYAAARKAVSLDPRNAGANVAMLLAAQRQGRDATVNQANLAVNLAPSDPAALMFAGFAILAYDAAQGLEWEKKATMLDPQNPFAQFFLAWMYILTDAPGSALALLQTRIEADPAYPLNHLGAGHALIQLRRPREALAEFRMASTTLRDAGLSGMARAYALLGKRDSALAIIRVMEADTRKRYVSKDYIGMAYGQLGMPDQAMRWLNEAVKDESSYLTWISIDPAWDSMRKDPRFSALEKKLSR